MNGSMKLLFKKEADYYMRKGTELKIICHGWGYNSVVQYLPNMYEALGSIPSSEKKNGVNFYFTLVMCQVLVNK